MKLEICTAFKNFQNASINSSFDPQNNLKHEREEQVLLSALCREETESGGLLSLRAHVLESGWKSAPGSLHSCTSSKADFIGEELLVWTPEISLNM